MATGIVTTARGNALNLDDLIAKAKRPIGLKEAHSTRTTANYQPATTNTPRVRGFVPAAGVAPTPESPTEDETFVPSTPKNDPVLSSFSSEGVAGSLADLTGVRVSKSTRTAKRQEAPAEVVEDDESLGSLLTQLDGPKE